MVEELHSPKLTSLQAVEEGLQQVPCHFGGAYVLPWGLGFREVRGVGG